MADGARDDKQYTLEPPYLFNDNKGITQTANSPVTNSNTPDGQHTLVVRLVDQEDGSPQWGVVYEHTRRPTPVFMNTKYSIRISTDRPGHVGADHQHRNNTRQFPSTLGRSMVGRCSTAKVDFGLLTPNFPLFTTNKQRRLRCALPASPPEATTRLEINGRCARAVPGVVPFVLAYALVPVGNHGTSRS